MADLNRICELILFGEYAKLLRYDDLELSLKASTPLGNFNEAVINFPPSYKYRTRGLEHDAGTVFDPNEPMPPPKQKPPKHVDASNGNGPSPRDTSFSGAISNASGNPVPTDTAPSLDIEYQNRVLSLNLIKSAPAWCDRILYLTQPGANLVLGMRCSEYSYGMSHCIN